MATSDTAIANSALIKIGESIVLTSLDDNTLAGRTSKRQFPIQRRALIRRYRWNFAMHRISLAADSETPPFGFGFYHQLPTDFIRVVGQFDENELQRNYTSTKRPFKVEGDPSGTSQRLLSDDNPFDLFYLRDITNVGAFDPLFDETLAWALAVDLSYALSTREKVRKAAREGFQESIRVARLADAIEGTPEIIQQSEWLDARDDRSLRAHRIGPIVF